MSSICLKEVAIINYLLTLFSEQPRHYRVIEGILNGRRTVAILFWGQQYHLLDWLRAAPHLSRAEFDHQLKLYARQGLLLLDAQNATARLTAQGIIAAKDFKQGHYWPKLGKWAWAGNNPLLPLRLWLGVQAVSELAHQRHRYVPVNSSPGELAIVRAWLHRPIEGLREAVYQEILQWGQNLAKIEPLLATLLVYQLPGFEQSGWTNRDAARQLGLLPLELPLLQRDLWAGIGQMILHDNGPLAQLCYPLVSDSPLNRTVQQTLSLFQAGMPLEQIARRRRLKISTIREHLLQAAILIPGCIDFNQLLGRQRIHELSQSYDGPVAGWHFQKRPGEDNAQAFFEFRAFQILKSGDQDV